MKKDAEKKINKGLAFQLYAILLNCKSSSLDKEEKIKLIVLRSKLKSVMDERDALIEEARKTVDEKELNETVQPILKKWTTEDIPLDTHVLSEDALISLMKENALSGYEEDVLWDNLKK